MSDARISSDSLPCVRAGQLIGDKYLMLEPLGAGGMGQVWAARNLATDAEVAIKLLHTTTTSPDALARFRREAHATGQLSHRGVLRVFDLVEEPDGSLAIVMERLRGRTLAELLQDDGPLTLRATLGIVLPILNALHHAHQLGIIHRDLKPENIFLAREPDGEVVPKLVDFGISKLLHDGNPPITGGNQIVGTPSHMSPEQLRGASVDARSDVFCAGIVIHMCITGQNPFATSGSMRELIAVLEARPSRPHSLSPSLWKVIERALAKEPENRFASAMELHDALSRCAKELESGAGDAPVSETARTLTETRIVLEGPRRRTIGLGVAACVAALSIAALCGQTRADDDAALRAHADMTREVRSPRHLRASVDVLAERESASVAPARARRQPLLVRNPGF